MIAARLKMNSRVSLVAMLAASALPAIGLADDIYFDCKVPADQASHPFFAGTDTFYFNADRAASFGANSTWSFSRGQGTSVIGGPGRPGTGFRVSSPRKYTYVIAAPVPRRAIQPRLSYQFDGAGCSEENKGTLKVTASGGRPVIRPPNAIDCECGVD